MIGSLRGVLTSRRPEGVIVDVNGVGYNVSVSLNCLSDLPSEGSKVFLYIHTYVREDQIQLFGFSDEGEKAIFRTLLGISGVGPKLALSILSGIPADKFIEAVESENTSVLNSIPGVGKKTANRLILELKEKLPTSMEHKDPVYDDVLSALLNLGYRKNIATAAIDKVYSNDQRDIETLLKESLKYLTNE
ncbi:MAG: Holliday junction branch migration protein RuvA [Nitrospirota bacterium]|nr:MAG: Holliday junction branch migration protein RuvA [Nitrospirota bacterium]